MSDRADLAVWAFVLFLTCPAYSFNFDDSHSQLFVNDRNSFGQSVLLQSGLPPRVLVGAPNSASRFYNLHNSGSVFECPINGKLCTEMQIKPTNYMLSNDSLLGLTIEGGKSRDEQLIICAPRRYRDTAENRYFNGICYRNNGSDITVPNMKSEQVVTFEGVSQYFYGSALFGMSAKYMNDKSFLIGAPGILSFRGSVQKTQASTLDPRKFSKDVSYYSYFGYSVTYVNLGKDTLYVAGSPRGNYLNGEVTVFKFRDTNIDIKQIISGPRGSYGSYFGSSLETAKLTNELIGDIIIGAPTFTKEKYDEGRVFVYSLIGDKFQLKTTLGDVDGKCIRRLQESTKFGTSIANLGVQNIMGNYETIAVSAPFEKNGKGAIYLYALNQNNQVYCTQKINSENDNNFGLSLSRGVDIDNNYFDDFAIGSKGKVHIIKSKRIVDIKASINSTSGSLLRNSTNVEIEYCFQLIPGKSLLEMVEITFHLKLDGRISNAETNFKQIITRKGECLNQLYTLLQGHIDYTKNFKVSMTYKIIECETCAVLIPGAHEKFLEIPYSTDCGADNVCQTDLKVTAGFNLEKMVLGKHKNVNFSVHVSNYGEPAYNCFIKMNISSDINVKKCPSYCDKTCQGPTISCFVENPLKSEKLLFFDFDVSRVSSHTKNILISVETSSAGVGNIAKSLANMKVEKIYDSTLVGSANPDVVLPSNELILNHVYTLRNNGPSPFEDYKWYFDIPTNIKGESTQYIEVDYRTKDNIICEPSSHKPLKGSTIISDKIPTNYTTILNCLNMDCLGFVCTGPKINKQSSVEVKFILKANLTDLIETLQMEENAKSVLGVSSSSEIIIDKYKRESTITTYAHLETNEVIPWWILILSIVIAIILLAVLIFVLYKCKFFDRLKPPKTDQLDEGLLEKRKSFKNFKEDEMYSDNEENKD